MDGRPAIPRGQAVVKLRARETYHVQLEVVGKASTERASASPQKANLALTW